MVAKSIPEQQLRINNVPGGRAAGAGRIGPDAGQATVSGLPGSGQGELAQRALTSPSPALIDFLIRRQTDGR